MKDEINITDQNELIRIKRRLRDLDRRSSHNRAV